VMRADIENFLYYEARLLDARRLPEWEQLFADDGRYLVPPVGMQLAELADPDKMLFIVADDRARIAQRVIRLMKTSAHAEYPPSRTRRLVSNVEILGEDDTGRIRVTANFVLYRIRRQEVAPYMGQYFYTLDKAGQSFRIHEKRACLDLDALQPQGALAFIL
jgi:p-cumate 2,3-dioxygenase subunit beta